MKLAHQQFLAILEQHPASRYIVAFSGGLDSTVLLYLCFCLKQQQILSDLVSVHVNHGLHPLADKWSEHCRSICQTLNINYTELQANGTAGRGESREEAARIARYQAFKEYMRVGDVLLTAHHQDDQAETFLLQLFRGAGIDGLGSMRESTLFGSGQLVRPLLRFPRQTIYQFARTNNLNWIDDSSNKDLGFDRNYLRHQIMPMLKNRWPGIGKTVSRSARHCAEAKHLLDFRANELLQSMLNQDHNALRISGLKLLADGDKRLVIRRWINQTRLRSPSTIVVQRILDEVIKAGGDRNPRVFWCDAEVNRYRDELYIFKKKQTFDSNQVISWNGRGILDLPGNNGKLQALSGSAKGINEKYWNSDPITVHYRQGGEKCRLAKRSGTHSLKNLFQENSIPPWVRERAPMIYINGQLAAVADFWVCETFYGDCSNNNIALRWCDHDLGWKSGDSHHHVA